MSVATPALPADVAQPTGFLHTLLTMSLTAVAVLRPLYAEASTTIRDFAWVSLNPAGQRMLSQPAQPAGSLLTLFPTAQADGVFDVCCQAFETGELRRNQTNYQADGLDGYFMLVAQRYDGLLVVNFTDTNDQPRTPVEEALRESQAREQAARAEAEQQRAALQRANEDLEERVRARTAQVREQQRLLGHVLESVPAAIATLSGPEHRFSFANARYQYIVGDRAQMDRSVAEALPEVVEQGVIELLDRVYQTGEPFIGRNVLIMLEQPPGPPHQHYYDLTYLPLRDGQGQVQGLLVFAVEVTEQVRIRRQATLLQAELLAAAQRQAQERQDFFQVFEQTPAAVSLLRGPTHRFEYVNPVYQQVFAGRQLVGLNFAEALPDAAAQGYLAMLDGVYQTGETFFGAEVPFVSEPPGAPPHTAYFTFTYQAYREKGEIVGISTFALDVTEQVLARQDRETQRRKLYTLFEQAPAGISVLAGPDLVYEFANPAYQRLLPGRALLGQSIFTALPELQGTEVDTMLRQVYATGETHQGQEECIPVARPGGTGELEDRYFTFVYQARRDEANRVTGILNFVFEVTEQVQARQQRDALQAELLAAAQQQAAQRETFYQVFEQTPAAISLQRGPEHRCEYVNAAYQRYFPGRELLGKTVAEAIPEAVDSGLLARLDRVYQTGETSYGYEMPIQLAQPDGSLQLSYFNSSYQALRENGTIVGISTFAYDVSAQVQARLAQEAQRQELEQLFWQAPAPIVILDGPDLVFQLVNPAYQQIFPGRVLAGKPLLDALPELVGTPIPDLFQRVYQTGEPVTVQELPLLQARYEGHAPEEIYWSFTYQARLTDHGLIDGVRVFAHDVTEQVRTRQRVHELNQALADTNQELATLNTDLQVSNEELNQSNRQLTRTNVDLDTFVYTASHDLKAPITNIESIVLALRDTLPAEVQHDGMVAHLLDLLDQTVARFQFTIGQLTDISRLQLAHVGPAELVHLGAVVESVRLDLAPAIVAAEAQLTVEVAPDLVVSFSPSNLRSIVYNLLSNAIKYRALDQPAQVRVQAAQTDLGVVLTVQDNGLGMSEVQQRQLFGLFQRLHTHVEGTGVGLYITKRLVENAGGTIAVRSQPGVGTTFTVTFPV